IAKPSRSRQNGKLLAMSSTSSSGASLAQPLRGGAPMSSFIDRFSIPHRREIGTMNALVEAGEDYFFGQRTLGQERRRLPHRDLGRLVDRITVDPAADGGEGDPTDCVLRREPPAVDEAHGQQPGLVGAAPPPAQTVRPVVICSAPSI